MFKADLHIHTTSSDSLLSPEEVVEWAAYKKLRAIGITDHDTINGIQPAIDFSKKYSLEIVPGIELSTEYKDEEIHILGYYIDYNRDWLHRKLNEIYDARYNRAVKMIEKLNGLGFKISLEQVKRIAESATIGRPHIARAMQEMGYIDNIKEAFKLYIGRDGPAYVERYKMSCPEAIDIIRQLGGVSVLAHPGLINNKSLINEILDMGIEGIEVYHSKHDDETIRTAYKLAAERKLLVTGGSDCHGIFINNEPILGNTWVDYKNVELLKEKSNNNKKIIINKMED